MNLRPSRRIALLAALAAGLPTAAAAQAAAPATSVVTASVIGPSTTFSEVSTSTDCGTRLVSGGGTRLAQSTPTVEHNGIRLYASVPSRDGAAVSESGDVSPTRWLSSGGSGGGVPNDAQTIGYGLCLDAGPAATQVVVTSAVGPGGTYATAQTTATCPAGSRLLSGGARTTPGTVGSLKPSGSFPSDAAGHPLLSGEDPQSWTVVGLNGGGGDQGNATHAFAVCATGADLPAISIAHAVVPGPAPASTAAQVSVACPAGTALLGGGGFISDAFGLPGSQGDHITGSYPSDTRGTPVGSGGASAWTTASHTGGVESGSLTQTDVWALCGRAADAPAPPPPASGGAAPANTKAPAISGARMSGQLLSATTGTWTNRPASYAYAWLRCTRGASSCAPIRGAAKSRYRLLLADVGARIRVRVTARNAAGTGLAAVSPATPAVAAGPLSAAQLRLDLRRQIVPTGRGTLIAPLLSRGSAALTFRALRAGRVTIAWTRPAAKGRPATVVARGSRTFAGALIATIDVRLTAAGRRVLRAPARVRLTATGTLTRGGTPTVRTSRSLLLTR
jgi:hypothetical protein